MFQTLPLEERRRLASMMREETVPSGRVLFDVGDAGTAMYVIRRGKVRISLASDSGEDITLAALGPGEFFGELALLDQNPRTARATTLDACVLYQLGRDHFLNFVGARPDTALAMLSSTAKRLRHTDDLMRSRAAFDVNEEFARHETRSGRWAETMAAWAGSWSFIGGYLVLVALWIIACKIQGFDQDYTVIALILGIIAGL